MNAGNWVDGYQPVDERIHEFRELFPEGRIATVLHSIDADRVIFRADVWKARDWFNRDLPDATGWAEEQFKGSGAKWAVENCETSAIGRALANLGLNPKGTRPSSLEMGKEARQEDDAPPVPPLPGNAARALLEARRHLNNGVDTGGLKDALSALPAESRGKARALLSTTAGGYTTPLPDRMDEADYAAIVDALQKADLLKEGQL